MTEPTIHQSTANPTVWHVRIGRRTRRVIVAPERGQTDPNPWGAAAAMRTIAEEMQFAARVRELLP